ncbi:filamentous hemagglutinin N-terminal domain-containing protein [Rivularia sp. UHCC 0363]|uniref:two-partner secretion domain-containing protein n=1 Tax=Rivularia sp. UHCC 0363 TaxID=3110244 RepID=UPI002B2056B2|nr:filamentous hemagglutinin N-terminal domain-containing protein [Rivularia sp. UHCC 0363]MEA5593312.1 filamentous hemagglutinin N-terminal domain-containing protein [Rivularia sp. UHCC 0363]
MKVHQHCFHNLAITIFTTIAFYTNLVNAQIVPDATLPINSSVIQQDNIKIIEGGTQTGSNLFHSFEQFSVPTNTTAYFNNLANIQNIITRITGKSISNIDGTIRTNGTANLFLINPSGIIFGNNASLDIGGSFFATTASSINFADGTQFSATEPQNTPLLTINVPIGLQFGATAPIRNQSQASQNDGNNLSNQPVGLQVPTGKTLALIGGDVTLEGGNLTVDSGRIELVAVGNNSFVSLNSTDQGWVLGYEGVENFQNIQLIQRSVNGSKISSNVIVDNKFGSGNIEIQGDLVELVGDNAINLINQTDQDAVDSGNLNITARKLVVRDGMQITSLTIGNSASSSININASESVEIIGGIDSNGSYLPSSMNNDNISVGKAGNMTINTSRLLIKDGAVISAESSSLITAESQLLPAVGAGGNIIVNAAESVELMGSSANVSSSLSATTTGFKNGGKLTISTKRLIVKDEAEITVSSLFPEFPLSINFVGNTNNLGNAGEINITADSITLNNQGKIISETDSANGGNINLQVQNLLLMRRNSQISSNAGIAQLEGDGGNININIPNGFIVAVLSENSDITANAFTGSGGRVDINATGILGIQPRSRDQLAALLSTDNPSELNPQELLTSDITAISQSNPNLNGILSINATNVEPTKELTELPDIPVDPKISQVCRSRGGNQSEFIFTKRGGLPPLPSEVLGINSALDVDWVDEEMGRQGDGEMGRQGDGEMGRQGDGEMGRWGDGEMGSSIQNRIIQNRVVEATGWVVDKNGDIYFVAEEPKTKQENLEKVGC